MAFTAKGTLYYSQTVTFNKPYRVVNEIDPKLALVSLRILKIYLKSLKQ